MKDQEHFVCSVCKTLVTIPDGESVYNYKYELPVGEWMESGTGRKTLIEDLNLCPECEIKLLSFVKNGFSTNIPGEIGDYDKGWEEGYEAALLDSEIIDDNDNDNDNDNDVDESKNVITIPVVMKVDWSSVEDEVEQIKDRTIQAINHVDDFLKDFTTDLEDSFSKMFKNMKELWWM